MKTATWIAIGVVAAVGGAAVIGSAKEGWRDGHGWGRQGGYHQAHFGRMGGPMGGHGFGPGMGFGHGPGGPGMAIFEELDQNQDGALTREEIAAALGAKLQKFDADADQTLTLQEFEGLWLEHTRSRMVDAFQFLDDDGDGRVTQAEMKQPFDRMARFADRNQDGKIDQSDLRRGGRGFGFGPGARDDDGPEAPDAEQD